MGQQIRLSATIEHSTRVFRANRKADIWALRRSFSLFDCQYREMSSLAKKLIDPRKLVDIALEATIAPSFTKIGPAVRGRLFDWEPIRHVPGRRVVITGANSGIGFAGARLLAIAGASVTVVARNVERGTKAVEELNQIAGADVTLEIADLSSLESVEDFANRLLDAGEPIDTLVHNAGALHNPCQESVDGNELTLATHVIGPFKLTEMLRPLLRIGDDPRVVTMASGGLYGQGVSMSDLQTTREYSGTKAYARAKRAQLLLSSKWDEILIPEGIESYVMHPGWVDTAGVADALPGFGKLVGPLLRSPEEGADTLAWLSTQPTAELGSSGFWLDRARRPEHRIPNTKSADRKTDALWQEISELAGVMPS